MLQRSAGRGAGKRRPKARIRMPAGPSGSMWRGRRNPVPALSAAGRGLQIRLSCSAAAEPDSGAVSASGIMSHQCPSTRMKARVTHCPKYRQFLTASSHVFHVLLRQAWLLQRAGLIAAPAETIMYGRCGGCFSGLRLAWTISSAMIRRRNNGQSQAGADDSPAPVGSS